MLLKVASGPEAGRSLALGTAPVVVGADEGCDLVLAGDAVAGRHLHLTALPTGAVIVNALDLERGASVGGERVECAVVRPGERVQVGDSELTFEATDAPLRAPDEPIVPPKSPSMLERIRLRRSVRRATILAGVAVFGLVAGSVAFATGIVGGSDTEERVQAIVAGAADATVLVQAQRGARRTGNGTGWVLDAGEGLVVTNAHVVNAGSRFTIGVGTSLRRASVVGVSPCEDLAVLRIADTTGLRALPLGSQRDLRQGETVVAVGYPGSAALADELSSTTGVVSVVRAEYREAALDVPQYPNVVQTDAAINPGNSGGPLLDLDGRVVGVNAAGRTLSAEGRIIQGQNYAIGVDRVRAVVAELREGRSQGWFGLGLRYLSGSELDRRGLPPGLLLETVVEGSPAHAARAGRGELLITQVGGRPVSNSLLSYCDAVDGLEPGAPVRIAGVDPGSGRRRSLLIG
jgi:S1-C subfamily serine protease